MVRELEITEKDTLAHFLNIYTLAASCTSTWKSVNSTENGFYGVRETFCCCIISFIFPKVQESGRYLRNVLLFLPHEPLTRISYALLVQENEKPTCRTSAY